jgi:hypothetical protein
MATNDVTDLRIEAAARMFESVGTALLCLRDILVHVQEIIPADDDVAQGTVYAASHLAHATYEKCAAAASAGRGREFTELEPWGSDAPRGDWVRSMRGDAPTVTA